VTKAGVAPEKGEATGVVVFGAKSKGDEGGVSTGAELRKQKQLLEKKLDLKKQQEANKRKQVRKSQHGFSFSRVRN
jgi:hypothetical protein